MKEVFQSLCYGWQTNETTVNALMCVVFGSLIAEAFSCRLHVTTRRFPCEKLQWRQKCQNRHHGQRWYTYWPFVCLLQKVKIKQLLTITLKNNYCKIGPSKSKHCEDFRSACKISHVSILIPRPFLG